MSGRSSLVASAAQQAALRELAGSAVRGEADRARAVLLTLAGWTAGEIGEAFGVGEDTVRRWRMWFAQGGVDALRATLAPGPAAERGERALACARELLAGPVQDRTNWTLARLRAEIEARTGVRLSQSHLSVLLRQRGAFAGAGPGTA
jgi:transposase